MVYGRDTAALGGEVVTRREHGVVLDRGGDDAVARGATGARHAAQGEVVGLGPARGEDDLVRLRPQPAGQTGAGFLHDVPGLTAGR